MNIKEYQELKKRVVEMDKRVSEMNKYLATVEKSMSAIQEHIKELEKERDAYFCIAVDIIGEEKVENKKDFILGLKKLPIVGNDNLTLLEEE